MSNPSPTSLRLRVLQCITRLGLGGAERVAFALMQELQAEIDFAVFTVHGGSDDAIGTEMRRTLESNNIPWHTGTAVSMKRGGMLPGGFALARAIRQFRPDIIHFHSETPEACGAVMAQLPGYGRRVALVRTMHNSVVWRYWPRIGRWCDRQLAPAAIACVSEAARVEFQRYRHDSGAPPPPFEPCVIYNGVSTPVREPAGPRDAAVRRVLFAGRFEPQKGTDILCAAIPLVQLPAGVKGELTFVGHGAQQSLVNALTENPPPGWTITAQPPVAKLGDRFPHFDWVVMPSRFEGLGLVAIEATLAGVPVVATDAPGLREALPADYPWRAAPGDAPAFARSLSAAFDAPARWREIVRAAQQFALARFSPAAMGAGYRRVYERVRARAEFAR